MLRRYNSHKDFYLDPCFQISKFREITNPEEISDSLVWHEYVGDNFLISEERGNVRSLYAMERYKNLLFLKDEEPFPLLFLVLAETYF